MFFPSNLVYFLLSFFNQHNSLVFYFILTRYVFFCNDWLSDSKGDTKTYRQLYCAQTEFKDGNTLFTSITRFRLFDEHLLLSLFGRPSFSRFSRVQRLYCIASMMSLSFLASAMFFKADDTVHIHGVSIGPMKVTYKQVYVGLMTSVMTFPVGFLMGYIFRNRRYKQNPKDLLTGGIITKDNAKLPWFFVFIGYGIAGSTLASGSFFTTLYSIQWGSETSTDWILSILFGTTNGIMFFDPFKVFYLALNIVELQIILNIQMYGLSSSSFDLVYIKCYYDTCTHLLSFVFNFLK